MSVVKLKDIKTIQIGPTGYRLFTKAANTEPALTDAKGQTLLGAVQYSFQRIVLAARQGEDVMRDTLLHEVLHCLCYQTDCIEHDNEEALVSVLTPALLDFLQRNPLVVGYLTKQ